MDLDARERSLLAAAQQDPRKRLGHYVLLEELGRGGMGVVHKGFDPRVGRRVAIKVLLDPNATRHLARFHAEAQLASRLQHPNLAQVYELNTDDPNTPYMVLQYVAGRTLHRMIRDGGPLDPDDARRYVAQIAEAIAAAHLVGVLHRDLKPANVMITPDDRAVVLDFGLAKSTNDPSGLTRTGELVGTVNYMAPELATEDHPPDTGVDIYGLGAVLYECLAGQPPYIGHSQVNVLSSLIHRPPHPPSEVRPGVDPVLEEVCLRCLARDPTDRYPDASSVARALQERDHPDAPTGSNAPLVVLGLGALGLAGGAVLLLLGSAPTPLPAAPSARLASSAPTQTPTTPPAAASSPTPVPATTPTPAPGTPPPPPDPRRAREQLERALTWTRQPIQRDPKRETAIQQQGNQRVAAALRSLRAAAAAAPDDPEPAALLAEGLWRAFKLEPALAQARKVLERAPRSRRAQRVFLRAACERYHLFFSTATISREALLADMEQAGRFAAQLEGADGNTLIDQVCLDVVAKRGTEAYSKLEAATPSPETRYWVALLLLGSQAREPAARKLVARSIQAALREDPRHPRACLLHLIRCLRARKPQKAYRTLARTGLNSQNAILLTVLAQQLSDRGKALALLDRAARAIPKHPLVPWTRAYLLRDEDPPAAIRHLARALKLDPTHADSYSLRASLHAKQKAARAAESDHRAALEHAPQRSQYYLNLASFLIVQGRLSEAEAALKKADPILSQDPTGLLRRAAFRLQIDGSGRSAQADADAAVELLRTQDGTGGALLTQAYVLRAGVHLAAKRLGEAEADLNRAFALRGRGLAGAYRTRGDLRRAQGRHPEAAADYRAFLKRAKADHRDRPRIEAYLRDRP